MRWSAGGSQHDPALGGTPDGDLARGVAALANHPLGTPGDVVVVRSHQADLEPALLTTPPEQLLVADEALQRVADLAPDEALLGLAQPVVARA